MARANAARGANDPEEVRKEPSGINLSMKRFAEPYGSPTEFISNALL